MRWVRHGQLSRELARHVTRCAGAPDDQELRDLRRGLGRAIEGLGPPLSRPSRPGRQRLRLLARPPNDLLEPAEFGLDLSRDDEPRSLVSKDDIDPTTRRLPDGHLRERAPSWVQFAEQRLHDARLMPVANHRAGVRIEPRGKVCAQRHRKLRVRLDRRRGLPSDDLGYIPVGHARGPGERCRCDAGVGAQPLDILGELVPRPFRSARGCPGARLRRGAERQVPQGSCPAIVCWPASGQ